MFSAKLNALESILLVCIFLRTSTLRRSRLPQTASLRDTDKFIAVKSSPLFLAMPLIKKKTFRFLCENCYSSIRIKALLVLTFSCK